MLSEIEFPGPMPVSPISTTDPGIVNMALSDDEDAAGMSSQPPTDFITDPAKQRHPDQEQVRSNKLTHVFSQLVTHSIIVYPNSNACSRALCFPR